MAIIKFTNSKAELKTIINYVTRTDKTNANLITGIHILQRQFGCKIKTVYAYKVEHQDNCIGALVGYFNNRKRLCC